LLAYIGHGRERRGAEFRLRSWTSPEKNVRERRKNNEEKRIPNGKRCAEGKKKKNSWTVPLL